MDETFHLIHCSRNPVAGTTCRTQIPQTLFLRRLEGVASHLNYGVVGGIELQSLLASVYHW